MKNVFVTGGSGFIGAAVVKELARHNLNIAVLIRDMQALPSTRKSFFEKCEYVKFVEGDLSNIDKLTETLDGLRIDTCYHFAWEGIQGKSLMDFSQQMNNVAYTMGLIKCLSKIGCKRFIGAGTIGQSEIAYSNRAIPDREIYYRHAKELCEKLGRETAESGNMEFLWPLITNTYGPDEISPRFICTLVSTLLRDEDMKVSEGMQVYDFVYIDDLARAFFLIGEMGVMGRKYVIGSGQARKLRDWIESLPDILGSKGRIEFGGFPYHGVYMDKKEFLIDALRQDTGYSPRMSFEEGIKNTAAWLRRRINL